MVQRGVPARSCADDDDHNVASMGGLVTVPPVVLAAAMQRSEHSTDSSGKPVLKLSEAAMEAVKGIVADHVGLTHRSDKLKTYATLYAELMIEVRHKLSVNLVASITVFERFYLGPT